MLFKIFTGLNILPDDFPLSHQCHAGCHRDTRDVRSEVDLSVIELRLSRCFLVRLGWNLACRILPGISRLYLFGAEWKSDRAYPLSSCHLI